MKVLGIDLGVRKIALAYLEGDELVNALAYASPTEVPRDQQLHELAAIAHDQAWSFSADSVWIEDTIVGNNRKYSIRLAEAKGAVLGMLAPLRYQQGMDIRTVDNKAWKKRIVGNGNVGKDAVRDYILDVHPAYAPLCGEDQDLYDAACIGLYGRSALERAQDLQL